MGLAQIKPENRIIFLKKFAAELVINSGEPKLIEERIQKQINVERLRQKFLRPIETSGEFKESIGTVLFQEPIYSKKTRDIEEHHPEVKIKPRVMQKRPFFHRNLPPPQISVHQLRNSAFRQSQSQLSQTINYQTQKNIQPQAQPRPENFNLGKLESLLRDTTIQSIECPGPGKNILVKRHGKINATKINLDQKEITELINNFAEKARIPVLGGILKAAVGDLIISAVISEFVGSRFIVNRITGYERVY